MRSKDDAAPAKVASKRTTSTVLRKHWHSQKTSSDTAAVEDKESGDVKKCGVCEQK